MIIGRLKIIPAVTETNAYQAFQIFRISTVLIISVLLVQSGLKKEEVSAYELFLFWGNIVSFFWIMGIKNAAISYYPKLSAEQKNSFFFNLFILLQGLGIIAVALLQVAYYLINDYTETIPHFSLLLLIYVLLYAPTVLIEIILILKKQAKVLFYYGLIIHGLQLLLIASALWVSFDLSYLFLALCIWMLGKWFYTAFLCSKNSSFRLSKRMIRAFFWFSVPLIIHILLGNGMEYIDGLLVNHFFDTSQFAVFRYGARELPFVLVMIGALGSVLIPLGVTHPDEAAQKIKNETRKLMFLFLPVILVLIFASPYLYGLFYSTEYIQSAYIFNVYLLIFSSRIIMVEVFMYAKHQNLVLMWVSGLELLINLIASVILMQWFGLLGIAWATVLAFAASKVFFIFYIQRKFSIQLSQYLDLRIYISFSVILYTSHFLSMYLWMI